MARVKFIRGSGGWHDYSPKPAKMSFCWQFNVPRVEFGLVCTEYFTDGIVFGEGPERPFETVIVPDEDAPQPPATPGFYVAGRAVIEGQLRWILRATPQMVESAAYRNEDTAPIAAMEPMAFNPGPSLANLAKGYTSQSKAGRSVAGYARNHWRVSARPAIFPSPGCVQREVEYVMESTELDAPAYEYRIEYLDEPGTYDIEGELCGVMYSAESSSDLKPHRAYLVMRRPVIDEKEMHLGDIGPGKGPVQPPKKSAPPPAASSSGSSGAGGVVMGVLLTFGIVGGGIALARHQRSRRRR